MRKCNNEMKDQMNDDDWSCITFHCEHEFAFHLLSILVLRSCLTKNIVWCLILTNPLVQGVITGDSLSTGNIANSEWQQCKESYFEKRIKPWGWVSCPPLRLSFQKFLYCHLSLFLLSTFIDPTDHATPCQMVFVSTDSTAAQNQQGEEEDFLNHCKKRRVTRKDIFSQLTV